MAVFCSSNKGNINRRLQYPANLLLGFIKEAGPNVLIINPQRANIIDSFKDVYHNTGPTIMGI